MRSAAAGSRRRGLRQRRELLFNARDVDSRSGKASQLKVRCACQPSISMEKPRRRWHDWATRGPRRCASSRSQVAQLIRLIIFAYLFGSGARQGVAVQLEVGARRPGNCSIIPEPGGPSCRSDTHPETSPGTSLRMPRVSERRDGGASFLGVVLPRPPPDDYQQVSPRKDPMRRRQTPDEPRACGRRARASSSSSLRQGAWWIARSVGRPQPRRARS